jgi:hypothetical protein
VHGAFAVFVVAAAPAGAARRAITGKLTKPGYTVIALAANGKAASARGASVASACGRRLTP